MENNQEQVRQRIRELIEIKGLNYTELSNENNSLRVKLTRQIKEGKTITCDIILYILVQFNLSAEWLLRGEGEMERQMTQFKPMHNKDLEELRKENAMLIETNRNLSRILAGVNIKEKTA